MAIQVLLQVAFKVKTNCAVCLINNDRWVVIVSSPERFNALCGTVFVNGMEFFVELFSVPGDMLGVEGNL